MMREFDKPTEKRESDVQFRQVIVFSGPEGSGKTTQAHSLSRAAGVPYVTIGDLVRSAATDATSLYHEETKQALEASRYPSAEAVLALTREAFTKRDFSQGVILDGYFRVPEQVQELSELLEVGQLELPVTVFYLQVADEECLARLERRGRVQDSREGNEKRLAQFHDGLSARLAAIEQKYGKITIINGEDSVDRVHAAILAELKS